ncbi:hypothetical protein Sjap_000318 [Stephania japonica]|uniref:Uncharacterized protein n=1 Tax=Stephania japonica TaxID=461633 RepID=A0AAP0KJE1_9MAGN
MSLLSKWRRVTWIGCWRLNRSLEREPTVVLSDRANGGATRGPFSRVTKSGHRVHLLRSSGED